MNNRSGHEDSRVGSSLVIHDCSSLAFGAAKACEFDAVKSVKENGFWKAN